VQYLSQIPGGSLTLLEEIKQNTHHYISVIADAADSQLAMLTTTGVVPADVYDNLRETVSCLRCCQLMFLHQAACMYCMIYKLQRICIQIPTACASGGHSYHEPYVHD
jgi:hypothetical protein